MARVDAIRSDLEEIADIREKLQLELHQVLLYWSDGSLQEGFLGAGVAAYVRRDGHMRYSTSQYELGFDTGHIQDAELFAIVAALGLAKKAVENDTDVKLVRVYSDALSVLERIASKKDVFIILGPIIAAKTALEALYQRSEWLDAKGVVVELVWVKGHCNSKGNQIADRCASDAVKVQKDAELNSQGMPVQDGRSRALTQADVPACIDKLGQEWSDEWLWRANQELQMNQSHHQIQHEMHQNALDAREKVEAYRAGMKRWRAAGATGAGEVVDDATTSINGESSSGLETRFSMARWGLGFSTEKTSPFTDKQREVHCRREEREQMFDIMAKRYAELNDPKDAQVESEKSYQENDQFAPLGLDFDGSEARSSPELTDGDKRSPLPPVYTVAETNDITIEPGPERWVGDALLEYLEAEQEYHQTHPWLTVEQLRTRDEHRRIDRQVQEEMEEFDARTAAA